MTRKNIFNYIDNYELCGSRTKEEQNRIKNVAMFLIDKRLFTKSIRDIEEASLDLLLDNLTINNEIIHVDDLDNYNITFQPQKKQHLKGDKILVLNFYNIKRDFVDRVKHDNIIVLDNNNYYDFKI